MIELASGTLYILNPDETTSVLGEINEAELTIEEDGTPEEIKYSSLQSLETSFELVARVSKEIILAITGVTDAVIKCCPNRKVVHLALTARKKRTRKKNFHRAIKILEEMANDL